MARVVVVRAVVARVEAARAATGVLVEDNRTGGSPLPNRNTRYCLDSNSTNASFHSCPL